MMNLGFTRLANRRLLAHAVVVAAGIGAFTLPLRAEQADQGTAPATTGPADLMNNAVNSDTQVFVDDSFKAQEKIRDAERFLKQGQTDQAIKAFQQITEEFSQKLVAESKDSYVSFVDYARGRMLAIPAVQKGAYDQLFGSQASKAFDAAIAAHDAAAVRLAADRYFPSSSTVKGLSTAADWAFENGDFATAAADWELLLTHPNAGDQQAAFLHHAALASKLAGRDAAAKALRDRLAKDFSDATGTIGGQQVALLANLDAAFAEPGWSSHVLPVDEWPMFQGSPDRSELTDVHSSAGANLWRIPLHGELAAGQPGGGNGPAPGNFFGNNRVRMFNGIMIQNGVDPNSPDAANSMASSYPVISQGQLFIHSGDAVTCLSAAGSNVLWTYPGAEAGAQAQNPMWANMRSLGAHDSVAVLDDVVYAIVPVGGRGAMNPNMMGGFPQMGAPNRLVALSRDGKELWSESTTDFVADCKEQFPKLDQGMLTLVGSPLATRGGIFAVAVKTGSDSFLQMFLLKLDSQTGKPRFATYICSTSQSNMMYGGQSPGLPIAIPTFADDTVYITTGQGADCAVSASVGRLLWLNVTEAGHNNVAANGPAFNPGFNSGAMTFADARSWKINPPLVYQDKLITRERSAPVRIYNRFNGKLLAELKPDQFGEPRIILGVVDGNLVTLGKQLCVTNIGTLQPAFAPINLVDRHEGKIAGRPFLSQSLIYLPFEKGLMTVSTADGKITNFSDWPVIPSDKPGDTSGERQGLPGNLLVTSEQIIVASPVDVAGYSKWETALANRQKAIAAAADSPKPYLDLAEIAFRTAHFDLAEQNMTKAVELAVAQLNAGGAAGPIDPMLVTHLYRTNLSFAEQLVAKSEPELRDRSRYYYNQARQVAQSPETQAQWRLCLAVLANLQNKPEEAAQLNSEVLTDPALRNAPFKHGDNTTRAGSTAEANLRKLIKDLGRDRIYKPFEAQAEALFARGRAAQDSAVIDNVIFGYPNSLTAITAASELADTYRDKHQYVDQLRVLTWLSPRVSKTEDRIRIAADFATANLGLRRYGAALAWAERGIRQFHNAPFTQNGQQTTFPSLAASIAQAMPTTTQARRPVLTSAKTLAFDPASVKPDQELAQGYLLTPIEANASLRKPDGVFVYVRGKVSYFPADGFAAHATPKWTADLKESKQAALLGVYANTAIIATPGFVHGIDVETGTVKYALTWAMPPDNQQRAIDGAQQLRAARIGPNGGFVNPGMFIINGRVVQGQAQMLGLQQDAEGGNGGVPFGLDADSARVVQLQAALKGSDRPIFTSLSILGSRLVAVVGNEVRAFDIAGGKACWDKNPVLPDGGTGVVVGNDELIVAQVDAPDRIASSLIAIDATTGQWHAKIQLNNEHVNWRALSDDGLLYTISDQAVAAWDLHADVSQPAWKKPSYAQLRYAFASQLTLDGLMLITNNADLVCIPLDGDDTRTWSERLRLPLSAGQLFALRTHPDGQDMIIQTTDNVVCYRMSDDLSNVAEAGSRMVWQAAFDNPGDLPPLVGLQLGDRHAALLAAGPTRNLQRAVQLVVLDLVNPQDGTRSNGSQVYDENITQWGDTSGQGPVIRRWQMVDKGIAFEIGGNVYVLRARQ